MVRPGEESAAGSKSDRPADKASRWTPAATDVALDYVTGGGVEGAGAEAPASPAMAGRTLRQLVLRGGTYMAARQIVGIVLSTIGMVLLTQIIGPRNYGVYIAALGVLQWFSFVSQCGLDVYLIRREGPTEDQDYDVAFTLLLVLGLAGAVVGLLLLPLMENRAAGVQEFGPLLAALFVGLPVNLLTLIPTARMERGLDYRRLSMVESANIVVYQTVSISAALLNMGAWSPVIGWWAQQVLAVTMLYAISGYHPRLSWNTTRAKTMLSYGAGYAAAMGIWQMRSLVGPLIILPWAGPAAVAYVGVATRFAEILSFVKTATWRLSISALARLNGDPRRALIAITEGMRLQVLLLAPPLAGFAIAAPYVMPLVFRDRWADWSRAMDIYPYIALGILCNAVFSLHSSMLFVLRRNGLVAVFHAVYVTLLFTSAAYFLPRYGLVGVGYAEIAAIASYAVIHVFIVRALGRPNYTIAAAWAGATGLLLFSQQLGWITSVGVIAAALWPRTWRTLDGYVRMILAPRSVSPA